MKALFLIIKSFNISKKFNLFLSLNLIYSFLYRTLRRVFHFLKPHEIFRYKNSISSIFVVHVNVLDVLALPNLVLNNFKPRLDRGPV